MTQRRPSNAYPWFQRKLRVTNPFPRFGHSTSDVAVNNELFIFGGNFQGQATNEVFVIETSTLNVLNFVTSGDVPPPRTGHTHVNMGSNMIGPLPSGRHGHSVTMIGTKMYIYGGQSEDRYLNDFIVFDMEKYNSSSASWEFIVPKGLTPPGRTAHITCAYGDKIYMFGGMDDERCYNDMWCYDIHDNTWTQLSCVGFIPYPRKYHSATIVDGIIYVFGGVNSEGQETNDLTSFQISTQRWFMFQNMGPSPSPRYLHTMSATNEKIFVFGGDSKKSLKSDEDWIIHVLDTSRIKYPNKEQQMSSQQQIPQQQIPQQQFPQQQIPQQQIPQQQIPPQQTMSSFSTPLSSPVTPQTFLQRTQQMSPQQMSPQQMSPQQMSPQQEFIPHSGFTSPQLQTMDPLEIDNSRPIKVLQNMRQGSIPRTQNPDNRGPPLEHVIHMERQQSNSSVDSFQRQTPPIISRQPLTNLEHQRNNSNSSPRSFQRKRISTDGTYYPVTPAIMRYPRPAPKPPTGYIMQPHLFGNSSGIFQNTIYQNQYYPNTNSYIESNISSPTIPTEGYTRISDTVDHSSSNLMNIEYNEFMKELEQRDNIIQIMSKREIWLKTELSLAKKIGYTIDNIELDNDYDSLKIDLNQLLDNTDQNSEKFSLLLNIIKIKQELTKSKATIINQAQIASQKITDSERIRTAALQEAAYFKAKLSALKNQSKSDLIILETERSEELEKTAEEAENSHAKSLIELASLHKRATLAESELREIKNQLLNSNIELKKFQNLNDKSQLQINSLQQSIDNLKITLEKSNSAMITASERATESETLWKQAQQDITNLEKESAGLRSQLDVRMRDLSRSAAKSDELEKMLERERKENSAIREMMNDGVNKLLNNSLLDDNSIKSSNDNSNLIQLEQEIIVLKNINEESQKSANEATNSLVDAKVKIMQMESIIMKSRVENTSLQRQLAEISDEVIRIKGKLTEKERILEEKSRILEDTEVKLGMMRDVMSERGILDDGSGNSSVDRIKELVAQCQKLEAMHANDQNDLKSSIKKYQEALKKVQEAENKSKTLEEELDQTIKNSVENDYNTAMHYVQGTEKMLRRLKDELQKSKTEGMKYKTQLESLQKRNEELEEKLQDVQNRTSVSIGARESKIHEFANKQLELQREDFKKEISEIQEKLDQSLEEKKALEIKYKQNKEEYDEILSLNDMLNQQLDDALRNLNNQGWTKQKEILEDQNKELERKLLDSENRITILLDQMENIKDDKDIKSPRDSNLINALTDELDELKSHWKVENKESIDSRWSQLPNEKINIVTPSTMDEYENMIDNLEKAAINRNTN
ncbi:11154_t:CDS:10 [Scutellospora calospora]|uniref:11154_t:CDS:1 n=1 Tax=Scutellospora calospora TaxID=85575 RepID=A0ACA9KEI7_9GLOM|nr:11154_t:CDS:10 [Scutellospora calospora]